MRPLSKIPNGLMSPKEGIPFPELGTKMYIARRFPRLPEKTQVTRSVPLHGRGLPLHLRMASARASPSNPQRLERIPDIMGRRHMHRRQSALAGSFNILREIVEEHDARRGHTHRGYD